MRTRVIGAVQGRSPFSLVIRNVRIVNVYNDTVTEGSIGIVDDRIAYAGPMDFACQAEEELDGGGCYALPGFVDAHMHLESSMLTPAHFAEVVLACGTTTVAADPHEIGNVLGLEGVRALMEAAGGLPLRVLMMAPSTIPSAPGFEDSGYDVGPEEFGTLMAEIVQAGAQAVGGQVEGDGYLLLEGSEPQLVFNLRGQELSLAGLSPVGGRVNNFQLSLVGTPKDPFLYGRGEVDSFSGPASLLERASAHFIATDSYLSLNGVQAQTGWGSARVPYANYDFRQPFLYAWMEADNFSLPPIRLANFGTLQGDFSGQAQVVGTPLDLNSLNLWGYSRSTNLRLGHLRIEGLRGLVGMNGFNLYFPSMDGYAAGGRVAAGAWGDVAGDRRAV